MVFSRKAVPPSSLIVGLFHHLWHKAVRFAVPLLRLWQPLTYILSLEISLPWTLHVNGIRAYVVFCVWIISLHLVLHYALESPLDSKEIKPVHPKGNPSWIFTGRTYAEAEALILDAKSRLIRKDPDTGKDWRQKEKRATEDEMASPTQWTWVWASSRRNSKGQRSLAYYSPWSREQLDTALASEQRSFCFIRTVTYINTSFILILRHILLYGYLLFHSQ